MSKISSQTWVALLIFTVIAAMLFIRRFDTVPEETVEIYAVFNSDHKVGEKFRRGEIIETKTGEFLAIKIGDDIKIGLYEKSKLELYKIFKDERVIRFPRGRIVVDNSSKIPLFIETNKSESVLEKGSATFVNYDFQQLVTIAPIEGSIQTHIKGSNEYLLLPVAINVNEKNPPSFEVSKTDVISGASEFYDWFAEINN